MSRPSRTRSGSSLSCAAAFAIESLELRRLLNGYSLAQSVSATSPGDSANFGIRIATNGTLALVAAPAAAGNAGEVSLVDTTSGNVLRTFNNPNPALASEFGLAVTWVGSKIAISAPDSSGNPGVVYVYDNATDPTPDVITSPYAGGPTFGVNLAAYGDDLLVATSFAPVAGNNGTITRYDLANDSIVYTTENTNAPENDQLGNAIAVDGTHIYASSLIYDGMDPNAEGVVVEFDGETGSIIQTIHSPAPANGNGFGNSIAVSGNNLLIDAGSEGIVYQLDKNSLSQIRTYGIPAGDSGFGGGLSAIAVNGNNVIFGNGSAYNGNDTDGYVPTGEAYVFDLSTGSYVATIDNPTPQNPVPDNGQPDTFGSALAALPGGKFIVGNPFADVGPAGNTVLDAGSIYVFSAPVVIPVNQPPTAAISAPASAAENTLVSLDASGSTDPDGAGDITSYLWDLDNDGQFDDASGVTTSFTPDLPGAYPISVQVTDSANHVSTASTTVTITDIAPTATAGSNQIVTAGALVNFSGGGTSAPGDAKTLEWDFDYDGNPAHFGVDASGANTSHTYASAGTFTAALRVTDDDGQVAISTLTVTVNPAAPANSAPANLLIAGPSAAVRLQNINFTGSFTDADASDTHTVSWNFGDGNIIAAHPSTDPGALSVGHAYAASGSYAVTMTIKDSAGASTTTTYNINVAATGVQGGVFYVGGTGAADGVSISKNASGGIDITVGTTTTSYAGGKIVIYGGAGNDVIDVGGSVGAIIEVHGGDGNDSIKGGAGSDILLGDAGDDLIVGGAGRDLLIGGKGADRLVGNTDDDILIAGTTSHDTNSAELSAILAQWNSSDSYATRVNNLRTSLLKPDQDVFDDGAADVLTGSEGNDWFLFNVDQGVADKVTDLKAAEFADDLDFIGS